MKDALEGGADRKRNKNAMPIKKLQNKKQNGRYEKRELSRELRNKGKGKESIKGKTRDEKERNERKMHKNIGGEEMMRNTARMINWIKEKRET